MTLIIEPIHIIVYLTCGTLFAYLLIRFGNVSSKVMPLTMMILGWWIIILSAVLAALIEGSDDDNASA